MSTKLKIAFLGLDHPHIWSRLKYVGERLNKFEVVGLFDEDTVMMDRFYESLEIDNVKRHDSIESLLGCSPDVVFVHGVDHDVCRLGLKAAKYPLKSLFLEKIGAAVPQELYDLTRILSREKPDLVIEWGWEMHYGDAMDAARDAVAKNILGDITNVHFHGGCPSGAGFEKWQMLETTLGGYVYTDGGHTIEQVVDLFGTPERLVSSIRPLPKGTETFKAVVVYDNMFETPKLDTVPVKVGTMVTPGGIQREDVASVIMEYRNFNLVVDFTGWEATPWCADWSLDIYGTNGTFHSLLDPSMVSIYLRESREGYSAGITKADEAAGESTPQKHSQKCFFNQMDTFFRRTELGKVESERQGLQQCGIDRQLGIMRIMEAMFKSAATNSWVTL